MERYFKRKSCSPETPFLAKDSGGGNGTCGNIGGLSKQIRVDLSSLPDDPGERKSLSDYPPKEREEVRKEYLRRGPCQPRKYNFPQKDIGGRPRRFISTWFDQYHWLEYSINRDAAYCFCCYLFKPELGNHGGGDVFVSKGFSCWKKKERLDSHVGEINSAHNRAVQKYEALLKRERAIQAEIEAKRAYKTRLSQLVDCIRLLLRQGFPLCGLAFEEERREGDFFSLLQLLDEYRQLESSIVSGDAPMMIKDGGVSGHAPGNLPMATAVTQKELMRAAAKETSLAIIKDLGDDLFGILVDYFRDASYNELIAVVLRFVDNGGTVKERFIGIVEVKNTSISSLKDAVSSLLSEHGLSLSRIRGQSYNAACNVPSQLCGLKSSVIGENKSAYYSHCFTLQLHSALVCAAKHQLDIYRFFKVVSNLFDVVGAPCENQEKVQEQEKNRFLSGHKLQEFSSLKGVGNSRWEFCYEALVKLVVMFSSVIGVLEFVETDGVFAADKANANSVLDSMYSFDFVISLHLMCSVLEITNELSMALRRKDCDIVNTVALVKGCKQGMLTLRNEGWKALLNKVSSLCKKHDILIPNMDDTFVQPMSRRNDPEITNLHHYRADLFYEVIHLQLQELDNCFDSFIIELLLCVACLSPSNLFHSFDKIKLVKLAKFYPDDFHDAELHALEHQLEDYIIDVRSDERFCNLNGLGELARMLVETKKSIVYHLVYALLKLALILPVSSPTAERAFSAMKLIDDKLSDQIGDQFMNDSLVTYVESDVFDSVSNDAIMHRFENRNAISQV